MAGWEIAAAVIAGLIGFACLAVAACSRSPSSFESCGHTTSVRPGISTTTCGLTSRRLHDAARRIVLEAQAPQMGAGGSAPAYDHADATALPANRAVPEALGGIAARRHGAGAE